MDGIHLKSWEEELQALEEELTKMDPAELKALEEEIANEKAQELITWIEEPTKELNFHETYIEYLFKGINKSEYMSTLKELKRLKKGRKPSCDGVKCMFKPESDTAYTCEHLEALMITRSSE